MKNLLTPLYIFLIGAVSLVSCTEETISECIKENPFEDTANLILIEASNEADSHDTKTTLQEDGSVFWNPNDRISLFFIDGDNGGNKFVSQNTETTAIATFAGTITGLIGGGEDLVDDSYFWATYPYSEQNSCDGASLTTDLPHRQRAIEGTFADDLFITVARAKGVKMAFKNVCGGVKFCLSQPGIKSVVFRGNNNETLAGTVKVHFDENNNPAVKEIIEGQSEITLIAPNGKEFEPDKFYYIIALPTILEYGFTMTFNKTDETRIEYNRTSPVTICRSRFGVVRNPDTGEAVPKDDEPAGGHESGFYAGIIGFNSSLYPYPIKHLSEDSAEGFYSFIDGLTMKNGTLLYHSVDKSIDYLQEATFPDDLYDVSIVTFTDGLDRGSLDMSDNYLTNSDYLSALNSRLTTEFIADREISAYSIGVIGNDVTNHTSFRNNLNKLASSSDNVFEVTNMSEVNNTFLKIADLLGETKYVQKFVFDISGPSHNAKCRFTFDNISDYSSSKQYIEGTFNRLDKTLENITYNGLTSTSGTVVKGVRNENNFYVFTFEGIQSLDGKLVSGDKVQHWYTEDGYWQKDSEFTFDPGSVGLEKIRRSAAVLLNLDCSSSLGDDFATLQQNAKSFMAKLIENAIDPHAVASIRLDRSSVTIPIGNQVTIRATVLPATALQKDVEWTSTNSVVASVDMNGTVTAHKTGNAAIIAKTKDGGLTDICYVSVVSLVKDIEMNHTSLTIYTDDKASLSAVISPEDATNRQLSWSSSNTSVATVDPEGNITPVKAGKATITATAQDASGVKATCELTVLQHVESISLATPEVTLNVGESASLAATVSPSDAFDKNIRWTSSDDAVVTVSSTGQITARKRGTAVITATAEDGGKDASCEVTVKQYVSGIRLSETTVTLGVSETLRLEATVDPEDADNRSVLWSSSAPDIASVSQDGQITALACGTATISAAAQDVSGIVATCKVTVKKYVSGISISQSSTSLDLGSSMDLAVAMSPTDASNTNFSVTSSNTSVVSVNKSSNAIRISATGLGSSTVTVTSEEGGYTATCSVTVNLPVTPSNLALAVRKNGVRYFIPLSCYSNISLSGYTKEGITIVSESSSLILALNDVSSTTYTFANANQQGTLASQTQATVICQNWYSINNALNTYGGTAMSGNYWTSTASADKTAYWYGPSGIGSGAQARTCLARKIIATL